MEFFNKAKAVRLKSHLDKYLAADDDEQTVRQSINGSSKKARWIVELVDRNPHVIRLKSCHGKYLTASDDAYLLGWTGQKVRQTIPDKKNDPSIEWEPIKEGYRVKLRTRGGKYLRANGATPPWRNSVTHDIPHRTATQDWVMWDVDVVDVSVLDDEYLPSHASSFSSVQEDGYRSSDSPVCDGSERRMRPAIGSEMRWHSVVSDKSSHRGVVHEDDYRSSGSPVCNGSERRLQPAALSCEMRWPSVVSDKYSHRSGRQDGMEFFKNAKSVRLQSHLGKYLVADEDEQTVRQSRNGSSRKARWAIEFVDGKGDRIRLKSCHGLYLTAAETPFLLGMTGKKVIQSLPGKMTDASIEWQPVKEGLNVKLMTSEGKFLRGNGGAPPWRNSVTHDVPQRTATQNWVLWGVDVVDITLSDFDTDSGGISPASSFSSLAEDHSGSPDTGSPVLAQRQPQASGMEFFKKAKSVRLKSHHDKYLTAESDEETVVQDRSGSSKHAKWSVEFVEGVENVIRLKSCFGKYLTSSNDQFLLGVTGQKVVQSLPRKLDSKIEWEPIRDGMQVKLKTRYGNYLRANGGLPPWRNSITHDIPHRHHDWILWVVDVIEIRPQSPPKVSRSDLLEEDFSSSSFNLRFSSNESSGSVEDSTKKSEGRIIYYYVCDDDGNVNDAIEWPSFQFKGNGLPELTQKLEEETGIENIIVCSRNRINGKLYPLRLALPPNNSTMHVVVVPSTSTAANDFMPSLPSST